MRVAVFSLGPLFPAHVHGGSQRTLESVVCHLAASGHQVSVYCTRRDDNDEPFKLGTAATVYPILRFRQTYPEPYDAAPYELAEIVEILARAAETHDRFYVHDGELLYHFVYSSVPTTISFQDFIYPTTLAGALSFRRDHLVLSSDYVRACVSQIFHRFRPLPADRISVVPNGFDPDELRAVTAEAMRLELGVPQDVLAVLYPHRPDPRKGILESLDAVLNAAAQLPAREASRVRLLVPVWMDSALDTPGAREYQGVYAEIQRRAKEAGRPDIVHFHPWVAASRMNEYYSLGSVTLSIGSFIEAFGNSSIESQLCGTPAVVSRVGAQRTVLPEHLIAKVDYGDENHTADLIVAALRGESLYPQQDLRRYVREHYHIDATTRGYAEAITATALMPELPPVLLPQAVEAVRVPAWCVQLSSGFYNDYQFGYVRDERLLEVAAICADTPVRPGDLGQLANDEELAAWIGQGHLAPVELT